MGGAPAVSPPFFPFTPSPLTARSRPALAGSRRIAAEPGNLSRAKRRAARRYFGRVYKKKRFGAFAAAWRHWGGVDTTEFAPSAPERGAPAAHQVGWTRDGAGHGGPTVGEQRPRAGERLRTFLGQRACTHAVRSWVKLDTALSLPQLQDLARAGRGSPKKTGTGEPFASLRSGASRDW